MRRALVLAAIVAAAWIVSASAQDFGFVSVEKKTDPGLTNVGVVGALRSAGLLDTALGNVSTFDHVDVATGDFNGDGRADIAAAGVDGAEGRLTLFLGRGDGTFGFPQVVALAGTPTSIALANPASAGGSGPGRLEVFMGDSLSAGTGITVRDASDIAEIVDAGFGDTIDLPSIALHGAPIAGAVGRFSGSADGFAVLLQPATLVVVATPGAAQEIPLAGVETLPVVAPRSLAVGVGNYPDSADPGGTADSDEDLFVATASDGVRVFENETASGGGFVAVAPPYPLAGTQPVAVAVGDVNGDGRADIVAADAGAVIASMAKSGAPGYDDGALPLFTTSLAVVRSVTIARLNDDANNDIAFYMSSSDGESAVHILLGDGSGGFSAGPVITSASGANGLPLRNVRSIAVGRFDARSTTDDIVLAVGADETTGRPGGVLLLSAAAGYDVVPVPLRTRAFHPCFELVAAALEVRDAELTGSLTPAQQKLKKAIATARAALEKPSSALATDLVTAAAVVKTLAKAFQDDAELIGLVADALDCAASKVRDDRDALSDAIGGLPSSAVLTKAKSAIAKADSFLTNAGTAANQAAIAKLLQKALKSVGKGGKQLSKLPSFVTATNDGIPFASDFLDFGYGTGGALTLFADDFDAANRDNFAEINLNLTGISGPGTYAFGPFPAANRAYIARNGPACGFSCPRWDAVSGTVTITSENAAARVVDGTFSFDANRVSGSGAFTTYVYAGRFHLRY